MDVRRATTYPYNRAERSFALLGGVVLKLTGIDMASPLESVVLDRGVTCTLGSWATDHGMAATDPSGPVTPMLAYGANASPSALTRKLGTTGPVSTVVVAGGELVDFDVVYSAHLSPYGAIPAGLAHCRGVRSRVHVVLANEAQRRVFGASEPNYLLAELSALELHLDLGPVLSEVQVYLTHHGFFDLDGGPVALAAVASEGRRYPSMTERQVLGAARDLLMPGVAVGVEEFVAQHMADPDLARRRSDVLRSRAHPFTYPAQHWRPVSGP